MASLPDPVWTVIIAMSAIAVVLILARLLFGKGIRRLSGLGFQLDLSDDGPPTHNVPPIPLREKELQRSSPQLPSPKPSPSPVAPSPLITELPSVSTAAKFMSDDYEAELAARLQYDARPKDYLYVEDHTVNRQGDC